MKRCENGNDMLTLSRFRHNASIIQYVYNKFPGKFKHFRSRLWWLGFLLMMDHQKVLDFVAMRMLQNLTVSITVTGINSYLAQLLVRNSKLKKLLMSGGMLTGLVV